MLIVHSEPGEGLDVSVEVGQAVLRVAVSHAKLAEKALAFALFFEAEIAERVARMLLLLAESGFRVNHF